MPLLSWNPDVVCPLTNPTTYNISSSGNVDIQLDPDEHAILDYPNASVVTGYVDVKGVAGTDNRVVTIGGSTKNSQEFDGGSPDGRKSHCLRFRDIAIAYVEGHKFDKDNKGGDAINIATGDGLFGRLYVQNCLGVNMNMLDAALFGHPITQHGDFLQVNSQMEGLFLDLCTFYTWSQGYLTNSNLADQFTPGPTILNGALLRRVNGRALDTASNPVSNPDPTHPLFYLQDDCALDPIPYTLEDVYAKDDQAVSPSGIMNLVMPTVNFGGSGVAACGGSYDAGDDSVSWSIATQIRGKIKYGLPPGGDYVSAGFTGLNYTSPGYVEFTNEGPGVSAMGFPLPQVANAQTLPDLVKRLNGLIRAIELRFAARERVGNVTGYATTNVSASRTFDADTVTLPQLADVVGTLIADLQKAGVIR